jgi:IS30 family transposase
VRASSPPTAKSKLPRMTYTHLTQAERYQIEILRKAKHTQSAIAVLLGRDKSCISRELRRNRGQRGYRPKQAHSLAQTRQKACANGPRVEVKTWELVESKLKEAWSPQQISGYLLVNKQPGVSHESIYQHIYADKRKGGTLHLTLRCQKERKKRHTGRARRGSIPNQVSIDLRPAVVADRTRFGDWEADLVIGAGQKQALVTINERISRYSLIAHVPFKTAELVSQAMIALLKPFSTCVHTLTTDNGREFAQHERIAATLDADFFFAHPYSSWERGANENMNGLIRQFFPKKMAFEFITPTEIELAMHRLNHRPRKCLGYRTPYEVFMEQLQLHNQPVALQT